MSNKLTNQPSIESLTERDSISWSDEDSYIILDDKTIDKPLNSSEENRTRLISIEQTSEYHSADVSSISTEENLRKIQSLSISLDSIETEPSTLNKTNQNENENDQRKFHPHPRYIDEKIGHELSKMSTLLISFFRKYSPNVAAKYRLLPSCYPMKSYDDPLLLKMTHLESQRVLTNDDALNSFQNNFNRSNRKRFFESFETVWKKKVKYCS